MAARLAFATALRADADTLLLDEVLAVGDAHFQRKCFGVFEALRRDGKTLVLVSHDLSTVQRFCDTVCWIDRGRHRSSGARARGGEPVPRRSCRGRGE
jgi:ABC-type polysaccharide/polyol phosphate transport system ATPase subunit